jgi:hypothetical protein
LPGGLFCRTRDAHIALARETKQLAKVIALGSIPNTIAADWSDRESCDADQH